MSSFMCKSLVVVVVVVVVVVTGSSLCAYLSPARLLADTGSIIPSMVNTHIATTHTHTASVLSTGRIPTTPYYRYRWVPTWRDLAIYCSMSIPCLDAADPLLTMETLQPPAQRRSTTTTSISPLIG